MLAVALISWEEKMGLIWSRLAFSLTDRINGNFQTIGARLKGEIGFKKKLFLQPLKQGEFLRKSYITCVIKFPENYIAFQRGYDRVNSK